MENFTRAFTVSGNVITDSKPTKKAGNAGENIVTSLSFTFSSEWDDAIKSIVFKSPKNRLLTAQTITGSIAPIPQDALDSGGTLQFSLMGAFADSEQVLRTPTYGLDVESTLSILGGTPLATYTNVVLDCQLATQDAITAKDAAVLATEQVNAAIEGATSTAVGLCEDQVSLANGYAEDASDSAILAANNILNGLNTHNTDPTAHASIQQDIRTIEAIARGRATAYVFDTLAALNAWVAIPANAAQLVVGDNLYIRALNVKDRWWDGTQIQTLESEAPDLTNYYLKSQVDAMMPIIIGQAAYDALVAAGTVDAGRIYYVTGA